jgi:hypothetical protein
MASRGTRQHHRNNGRLGRLNMKNSPKTILENYRSDSAIDGFCEAALDAASTSKPALTRSIALWCMGVIARYSEYDLSMGNAGYSYFVASLGVYNKNVQSCFEIITLYKEMPDGHSDGFVAETCIQTALDCIDCLSSHDIEMYGGQLVSMQERGGELARFDELCKKLIDRS